MSEAELVSVASLFVGCALKVHCLDQPGYAASDSCGHPARYAVEMPSGARMYRCMEHRSVRWLESDRNTASYYPGEDRTGPTYTMVRRQAR